MMTATERYQAAVSQWAVRPAMTGDLDAVLGLTGTECPGIDQVAVQRAIGEGRCLVAQAGGVADAPVVGFIIHDTWLAGRPMITALMVAPDMRHRGVGSALGLAAMAAVGGDRLFASARESDTPMRMLLGRIGFVASGYVENLASEDADVIYVRWMGDAAPVPIPAPIEPPD
jgi:ribosomal protein S18 acetylase RimI-like enzyme